MRVLLIAPDLADINNIPEIRDLTEMHRVMVFNGTVRLRDLYEYCRRHEVDVIHVVSHSDAMTEGKPPSIMLSNDEVITPQDLVMMAQWSKTRMLFLNTCSSAVFATYATRRGIPSAIYTTRSIRDDSAWKVPMGFYSSVERMVRENNVDFYQAYLESVPDTGDYGWSTSTSEYQAYMLKPVLEKIGVLADRLDKLSTTVSIQVESRLSGQRRSDMMLISLMIGFVLTLSLFVDYLLWVR